MAATTSPATSSPAARPASRAGFGRLLLAEWVKLRSVPRWLLAMAAAAVLTVLVSSLGASGSGTNASLEPFVGGPDGIPVTDRFEFMHQPLTGDGGITARLRSQVAVDGESQAWAKAGVMLKESTTAGAPYAAMLVTPGHGVRMQANFTRDTAGGAGGGERWLRLTREGTTVTGYSSADGVTWSQVDRVDLAGLPPTVQVGLFVASPDGQRMERQFGSVGILASPTVSRATFDNVQVAAATPGPPQRAAWTGTSVGPPRGKDGEPGSGPGPGGPAVAEPGATESGGTFTLTGSGDIAPDPFDDDLVRLSLTGAFVGLMVIVALSVLFITSEFKHGMIRTTFAATPRRGRVLAAKAVVIGLLTFVVGLAASVAALLLSQPTLRANGFTPPLFPEPSLTDGPTLRALIGTAAVLALVAVLGLALGTILRHSAGAITIMIVLMVLPQLVAGALPLPAAYWLLRVTPAAGFSIQQTTPRYDHVVDLCLPESGCFPDGPWLGFAVLCAYALVALVVAGRLLARRDA